MARAPRIQPYDQRTTPQGARRPTLHPVDTTTDVPRALAQAGAAVAAYNRDEMQRAEDDGRLHAAKAIAEYRARAVAARREALEAAPDGFRDLTNSTRQRLAALRQEFLDQAGAVSPIAQRFVGRSIDLETPLFLEETEGMESAGRGRWQEDAARSAFKVAGSVIAADPRQYDPLRAQQLEALSGIENADLKRDLTDDLEEELSVSAVSGMVERDPAGALRMLRDPEAGGPFSRLSGPQRNAMENRAQAELNRRAAEARARQAQFVADLRDRVAAQQENMRRGGGPPSNPVPIDQIAQHLGADRAQSYVYDLQSAAVQQGMVHAPNGELRALTIGELGTMGAAPGAGATDFERGLAAVQRDAAAKALQHRNDDPGAYGVNNGIFRHPDILNGLRQARQPSDVAWAATQQQLRERGADAVEAWRNGVLPRVAPFTKGEAQAIAAGVERMSAPERSALFSQLRAGLPPEAYIGAMAQIAPNNPVAAHAGAIAAQRRGIASTATLSDRILHGQALLSPPQRPGEARPRPYQMPSEQRMQERWRALVGDAYRGTSQEGAAYETFRAYYAYRANEKGLGADSVDLNASSEAAQVATGGIQNFNGRQIIAPYGYLGPRVFDIVRRDWERFRARNPQLLRGVGVDDIDLISAGNGRYRIQLNGRDVPDRETGRPMHVIINE